MGTPLTVYECPRHRGRSLEPLLAPAAVCTTCGATKPSWQIGWGPCILDGDTFEMDGTPIAKVAPEPTPPPAPPAAAEPASTVHVNPFLPHTANSSDV